MAIVDSHCHVSPVWFEPVETLVQQMDANGVAQAVLVQLLGQVDNAYLSLCRERYPDRFATVVGIDVTAPQACDELTELAADGAAGVRLRPDARSPGGDPLAIWRTAQAAGLAVSCVGNSERFASPEFGELLDAVPDLPIVLEHLGGNSDPSPVAAALFERVLAKAAHANVYLKVPGLGELVPRPQALPGSGRTLDAALDELFEVIDRFGPSRLMWGSDFPVVSSREGYANALSWTREAIAKRYPDALEPIFGGTANRVFKLDPKQ